MARNTGGTSIPELVTRAERASDALQNLTPGMPFEQRLTEALDALEQLDDALELVILVGVEPVGADVFADLEWHTEEVKRQTALGEYAMLHNACVHSHPKLARLLRSREVLRRLQTYAEISGADNERLETLVRQYCRLVAEGLRGMPEFEPAASVLIDARPRVAATIKAAQRAHEEHARAEAARIERQAEELLEQANTAEADRRNALASFFDSRGGSLFVVAGNAMTGTAVAAAARQHAAHDTGGRLVRLTLADIETARDRAAGVGARG